MRWKTRMAGDTRIVSGFLFFPRAMAIRLAPQTKEDPGGRVTTKRETRFWEFATWKQQWGSGGLCGVGWNDISWENVKVGADGKTIDPWKKVKMRRCEVGPPT